MTSIPPATYDAPMLLTAIAVAGLLLVIPFVLMLGNEARVQPPRRWFWPLTGVVVPVANVAALALTDGGHATAVVLGVLAAEAVALVALLCRQRVTRLWTHVGGAVLTLGAMSLLLTFVAVAVLVVTRYPRG